MDKPSQSTQSGWMDCRASLRRRGHPTGNAVNALFLRLFTINGLIFAAGTLVLAISPASVSSRVQPAEIPVLVVGLVLMVAANAVRLRSSLAPLDRLVGAMRRVDPPSVSDRVLDRGNGDLDHLISSFNAMLDRMEAERASANAAIISVQENERQRIARELHDEMGQSLTVVLLTLKRTMDRAPDALRDELHSIQETVRECLDEVREMARRLRPGVLTDLGLHSALNALCSEFTAATGIGVVKRIGGQPLTPDVELVCYRIAQESLTNVARHARANRVTLDLHTDVGQLTLRIVDDGVGGISDYGGGITGMRERALLVNGRFTVCTSPGGGTEVRLTVPLTPEHQR